MPLFFFVRRIALNEIRSNEEESDFVKCRFFFVVSKEQLYFCIKNKDMYILGIKEYKPQEHPYYPFITSKDINLDGVIKKGDIVVQNRDNITNLDDIFDDDINDQSSVPVSYIIHRIGELMRMSDLFLPPNSTHSATSSQELSPEALKMRCRLRLCFQQKQQKVLRYLQEECILDGNISFNNNNANFKKTASKGLLIKVIAVCVLCKKKEEIPYKEICAALSIEGNSESMRTSSIRALTQTNGEKNNAKAFEVCRTICKMCDKDFNDVFCPE